MDRFGPSATRKVRLVAGLGLLTDRTPAFCALAGGRWPSDKVPSQMTEQPESATQPASSDLPAPAGAAALGAEQHHAATPSAQREAASAQSEAAPDGAPAKADGPVDAAGHGAPAERSKQAPSAALALAAALVAGVSLLAPIAGAGIWDPPELNVADFARRIALNRMGAASLALPGANNEVPTLGELGRGELPFTSIAAGFKVFGLHDWAGRLPLALWAVLGAVALYLLVSRLADRKAAALSVIVLATTPIYFLQARTMLGDAVTLSAVAIAVAGLGLAVFERGEQIAGSARMRPRQLVMLVLGLAGLAAGFGARGALIGVAVPCLAVGLSWAVSLGTRRASSLFSGIVGVGCLLLGGAAARLGIAALLAADPNHYSIWLGAAVEQARQRPTFDLVIEQLGHGLLPWGAILPFAIGRLFVGRVASSDVKLTTAGTTRDGGSSETRQPCHEEMKAEHDVALRVLLVMTAALAFAAHALMAPVTGELAFCAVFALAAMVGLLLRDADRGFGGSLAAGASVVALAVIFYTDYKNFPDKGLVAFVASGAKFPDSFSAAATRYIKYGGLLSAALFALLFMESERQPGKFERSAYVNYIDTLRNGFQGNLRFFLLLAQTAVMCFAALSAASTHVWHWNRFESMPSQTRGALGLLWLVIPAVVLSPLLVLLVRDGLRWFFARTRLPRLSTAGLVLAAFGLVLSLGYYPALAAQISPKEVFEAYARMSKPGEPLAMLGQSSGSASYYAGGQVVMQPSAAAATRWLDASDERRWLVMGASDLPQMNSKYREKHHVNLPVLDGRSSEILLVSNQLGPGERNESPFADWVLDEPRPVRFKVDADLDQLTNLGWEITDMKGNALATSDEAGAPWPIVKAGTDYRFSIHWRVNKVLSGNWKTFIHIDGYRRRYNGDHDTLDGKYPVHLWRPGDQIVDIHTVHLEPHFTPGRYEVLYGLYIGDRRLEVRKGAHDNNRIKAGLLIVQ